MDINSISFFNKVSDVNSSYRELQKPTRSDNAESFESLLNSIKNMVKETDGYSNAAKQAEMEYALGLNDNVHDLLIAQQKANITLQYTVAVKNAVYDAYQEIMQIQF